MRDLTAEEADCLQWGVPDPAQWWQHAQDFFADERADVALADKMAYCNAKIASGAKVTRAEEMAAQDAAQAAKGVAAVAGGAEKAVQRTKLALLLGVSVADLKF